MPSLTIRHVTTYRYRQPVAFGEHRMMLRPRDSHDQRVTEASLEISPEPMSLRFVQDAFGNHVGIARFSGCSKELRFESTVCLDHTPLDAALLSTSESIGTSELLARLSRGINRAFLYRRREEKGIQPQWRRSGSAMAAAAISPC